MNLERKKRIIFDFSCLSAGYSGTVTYASYALKSLLETHGIDKVILSSSVDFDFLKKVLKDHGIKDDGLKFCRKKVRSFGFKRDWDFLVLKYLHGELKKDNFLFVPTEKFPLCHREGVVTIHDMRAFDVRFKGAFTTKSRIKKWMFRCYSRASLSRASKIVTVSQFTKSMLDKKLRYQNKESILIPNVVEKKKNISVTKEKIALCIADYTKPHKNWGETVILLRFLKELGYKAVVVSKPSYTVEENLKEIGGVLKSDINKEEIQALYQEAELYLNVSKYEGFGIPLVEAALSGCKILCSDLEVFHEVLDGYDYLVVPSDYTAIKSYLERDVVGNIDMSRYSLNNMKRRIKGDIL